MAKLEHAIRYREGGQYPISDEKLDTDIEELIEMLSHIWRDRNVFLGRFFKKESFISIVLSVQICYTKSYRLNK